MIYPQASSTGAGGSAGKRAGKNSTLAEKKGAPRGRNGKGGKPKQVVQWKQKNVEEGIVVVDEQQLSKLIKREPIEKHYKLDPEPFATGLFATVRRCVSLSSGEVYAAKFSSRARYGEDCSAEIHHEIALLSLCAPSPRIVKLHDVFETATEIIILMQFAPGGDLQTVIDDNLVPFETDVINFVRQLVEGLAYLHERKIAHLDIKPQNLVMMGDFPNCDVKLCDFEISRVILEGTEIREILGTPDYVAPEILHYEPITLAADLWSLGVTTYVLLTGFSPFGGETDQETFCNISRAQLDFPEELFEDVSQDARDFIRQLLVREPSARPTAKNLLRHRWLSHSTAPRRPHAAPRDTAGRKDAASERNLRKYLSKSREALFERVVQQQRTDLRKTTLLSQYNKTRMCESHMSLVSKTREDRPLMSLSPSFSRSREKLYGLRSLSRSHEGLDLLRLTTSPTTPGGTQRAYARATTADLSMLPLLRLNENPNELEDPPSNNDKLETESGIDDETSPVPDVCINKILMEKQKTFRKTNSDSCITISTLVSPTLLKTTLENCSKQEKENVSTLELNNKHNGVDKNDNKSTSQYETTLANHMKLLRVENNNNKVDTSVVLCPPRIEVTADDSEQKAEEVTEKRPASETCTEEKEMIKVEENAEVACVEETDGGTELNVTLPNSLEETPKPEEEFDEPSFTVAQLISAYNRHQEIVTKTSLEVTMTTGDKTAKLPPPIVPQDPSTKFPTGPTALRLFIPDIDIETTKKKKNRTKSYRTLAKSSIQPTTKESEKKEGAASKCTDTTVGRREVDNGFTSVEQTNTTDSYVSFLVDPPAFEKPENLNGDKRSLAEVNTNFLRSASLSSETSGGMTPSETFSSLSWEEVNVATIPVSEDSHWSSQKSENSSHWPDQKCEDSHWPIQKSEDSHWLSQKTASLKTTTKAENGTWDKLCTGSYTRAMEKFGVKTDTTTTDTKTVTAARKCSLSMLMPPKPEADEKVRRKSTSTIKLS